MFYSNQILARKGPLGLVWIAAHMDGRLKRQQINSASIPASVDTLLDPEVPLALRLSGQLLLGVVRIYARKVAYLQQDCDAALVKIRVALRPADNCNLPPDSQVAPVEAITMLGPAAAAAVTRKARAAKAAADGKNNAAAAAAVDSWMGPVDEEGLMLGLDDIAWDQEGFLGDAGEPGFGMGLRFEPNSRLSLGLAPSRSGLGSQDISGVFGMYSSQDEMQETFDVEDEAAAAVWDLDDIEVERLRAAPSQSLGGSQGGLSELLGGDTPAGGVKSTGKTTHAAAFVDTPSEGGPLGHEGFTPGSMPDMMQAAAAGTEGADDMDLDLNPEDALPATPRASTPPEGAQEAADDQADEQQQDPYDLDDLGNLGDLLPPTPAADEDMADAPESAAAAAGDEPGPGEMHAGGLEEGDGEVPQGEAAATTKTFQRRNTRQQAKEQEEGAAAAAGQQGDEGQEAAAAAEGDTEEEAEAKAKAAAKSARRRRVSGLLGHKRRVVLDAGGADATGSGGGVRHAPTELPAAEIRALLSDRAPLMDMERLAKVSRHLQQQATASSLTAHGAAAAALAAQQQQQQQLLLLAASTAAGAGPSAGPSSPSAAAAAAAAEAPVAPATLTGVFGPVGLPCSAGLAGGLGLPLELQQLFKTAAGAAAAAGGASPAAAAAAATPGASGPAAAAAGRTPGMAPTAPLEEIGGYGDEVEDAEGFAGAAAALNPALAAGATRCSLSLSLTRTPGSAGAAAGSSHPTPGTDAAAAAGVHSSGHTPGYNGLGASAGFTPGEAGYTPGLYEADDVLQPLDDVNLGQDDVNLGQDDVMQGQGPEWDEVQDEEHGPQKENTPLNTAGKGAAVAAVGGGSSVRVPWPADAETLLEQEAADQQVPDGSFTARTRLVVRHLQHAAATAAAPAAGGYATAATAAGLTPGIGSKRRISAAAAGLAGAAAAAGKDGVGSAEGGAAAAGLGPVLSFEGISAGHNRLDACRWFYEMLVLSNKGLVTLRQDESYGDISVTPNLAGMARV